MEFGAPSIVEVRENLARVAPISVSVIGGKVNAKFVSKARVLPRHFLTGGNHIHPSLQ